MARRSPGAMHPGSLSKAGAMRRSQSARSGWLLVLPLGAFTAIMFILPIGFMLWKSFYDPEVDNFLPRTTASLSTWQDKNYTPDQPSFDALQADLLALKAADRTAALALLLNRERPGLRQLIEETTSTVVQTGRLDRSDPRWQDPKVWNLLQRLGSPVTDRYFLGALDLKTLPDGSVARMSEDRRIYLALFGRTIIVALAVTAFCIILGYPFAYALASATGSVRSALFFVVMLPFWTSLLVRTTAWIVLLQRKGVINELLLAMGLIDNAGRLELIYNLTGTLVVMTHVLLPFFVLPLHAVMQGIPGQFTRAARSLGGGPFQVFTRVYLPMSMPGVVAGASLVFILSLGFYLTPALVGGRTGQLISSQIAFHIQSSLNWGLAAALGTILLAVVASLTLLLSRFARQGVLQ